MSGKAANSLHSPNKPTAPAGKAAVLSAANRTVVSNKQQPNAPAASAAPAKAGQKLPGPGKPGHAATAVAKVGQSKAPVMTKAAESSSSSSSSESEEENETPTAKAPAPKVGKEPAGCGKCMCAPAFLRIRSELCLQRVPFSSLAGKLRAMLVPWGGCKNTAKQPALELCGMNPACLLPFQVADSVLRCLSGSIQHNGVGDNSVAYLEETQY